MTQAPSVGRVVHYVAQGFIEGKTVTKHLAAMIVDTRDDGATVDLVVLSPSSISFPMEVAYSEDCENGTWHWPERV